MSSKDITDYTVVDTEYWRETKNRLLTKTAYDYNNKESIKALPKTLGEWRGFDYKYPERVYKMLNADMYLSRGYTRDNGDLIWVDFINSKIGESFHKQRICAVGQGFTIDNEDIAEFRIADPPNPFTKLYTNRLDLSKKDDKQIVIYWFMFKKFGAKDAVTMIRIIAPINNSEAEAFNTVKDFIEGQLFDAMYKKGDVEIITNAENIQKEYGNKGLFAMMIILLIPISLIIVGTKSK